jgi:hypothetical protein
MINNISGLPDKLTLMGDKNSGFADHDYVWDSYVGKYATVYKGVVSYTTATAIKDWLAASWYEIESAVPQYPDALSFTHDTTSQRYDLVKLPHHNLWACQQAGLPAVGSGATYTAEEIAENFEKGHWWEAPKESVTKERELVFPMTVEIPTDSTYYIYKDTDGVLWMEDTKSDWVSTVPNLYSDEGLRNNIVKGSWRVVSVGSQKAPEAVPEPSKPLTIQLDSEQLVEATERAEALAQAVELVNIALEDFYSLIKKLDVNLEVS